MRSIFPYLEVIMSKARLLVVEDDLDISSMLKIFFSSQGYEVDTALRGEIAMEKTRLTMPHLIILDIMLPDIDGYEVCRRLRSNSRTSHMIILLNLLISKNFDYACKTPSQEQKEKA